MIKHIEPHILKMILLVIVIGIAAYFLWDYLLEIIIGATGLKVLHNGHKKAAEKAKIEAEVYQEQADIRVIEAAKEIDKAVSSQQSAVEIGRKQPEPVKEREGFKRKSIRSS